VKLQLSSAFLPATEKNKSNIASEVKQYKYFDTVATPATATAANVLSQATIMPILHFTRNNVSAVSQVWICQCGQQDNNTYFTIFPLIHQGLGLGTGLGTGLVLGFGIWLGLDSRGYCQC